MSIDGRLQKLEAAAAPQEPITIRLCRVPAEIMALDRRERDEWVRLHPECVEKVIEVPAGGTPA